jgi:hypothetical protein
MPSASEYASILQGFSFKTLVKAQENNIAKKIDFVHRENN